MPTPRHYPLHLIIIPIMELALMLAIAAYITVIDMNLLYLLSIPLGASIGYFLSPRTIEDYYDHDYTKYEQSIALMVSNLLCLMVVTYYNVPVFVAILVYIGIYSLTRKALQPWPITTSITRTTSVIRLSNECIACWNPGTISTPRYLPMTVWAKRTERVLEHTFDKSLALQ